MHPAVAEAAVVGFPHDIKGQGIYAYVTLKMGVEPTEALRKELVAHVRKEIGPIASPDVLQWAPGLPKTRSGKMLRKAFEKAKFVPENGLLVTAVTQYDIEECEATPDDIYQVASIPSTVPEAKFALVLSERDQETVRGSLRASERYGVDVSSIAHQFGGGGHKMASGFEVKGKIVENELGWSII